MGIVHLDNSCGSLLGHVVDGILVAQPVTSLDGVVPLFSVGRGKWGGGEGGMRKKKVANTVFAVRGAGGRGWDLVCEEKA